MKNKLLLLLLITSINMSAQEISIIPQPSKLIVNKGVFLITSKSTIKLWGKGLEKNGQFLHDYIQKIYGLSLKIEKGNKKSVKGDIILNYEKLQSQIVGSYMMEITGDKIYITSNNGIGVFYGLQTLFQLLPTNSSSALSIPQLTIEDSPRFAYRGMHLDVARHFFSVDFVKKYIDFIAMHKMNTFHWHLTEDQGWRIEIKKYPKLTSIGATRNGTTIGRYPGTGNTNTTYTGYYTQEQIKEVVKYAAARYIEIIPEIELPGHSSAAIAAYPALSCFPEESTKHPAITAWSCSTEGKQVQQTWGVFEDVYCPTEFTFNF